jgi:cation:H+ antiporter
MGDVILWPLIFAASLACLVKSADLFIGSAEKIGLRLGLPRFLIGVSIVAVGTSLPELLAAVVAVWAGATGVAIGIAVGSNVTNILLILGTAAILGGGIQVAHELVRVDLPFLFGSALLLALVAFDGTVYWWEGLLCVAGLSTYLVYATRSTDTPLTTVGAIATEVAHERTPLTIGTWVILVAGAIGLQVGAHYTIESTVRLSEILDVSRELIAASAIALGTSLPELTVTLRAARAGQPEIAVGNVIGSNIFNALGVIGVASFFGTLSAPVSILAFALPAMVGVTVLGFFVLQEREATAFDGWLLLVLYIGFNMQLFQTSR